MKKKFISVLTALMVLSMSTTVFAAKSPSTDMSTPVDTEKVEVAADAATAVTEVEGATVGEEVSKEDVQAAAEEVVKHVPEGFKGTLAAIVELTGKPGSTIKLTVPKLNLKSDESVFVLHIMDNGKTEKLDATVDANGVVSFVAPGFSKFAVVKVTKKTTVGQGNTNYTDNKTDANTATETTGTTGTPTSPKTGVPAALPMMAAICLAGAGVCTKKAKFN